MPFLVYFLTGVRLQLSQGNINSAGIELGRAGAASPYRRHREAWLLCLHFMFRASARHRQEVPADVREGR